MIFHFDLAVMRGKKCAFAGCSSNCRYKKISLFKLPIAKDETTEKWRKEKLNVITKDRVVDANFKKQIEKDHAYV